MWDPFLGGRRDTTKIWASSLLEIHFVERIIVRVLLSEKTRHQMILYFGWCCILRVALEQSGGQLTAWTNISKWVLRLFSTPIYRHQHWLQRAVDFNGKHSTNIYRRTVVVVRPSNSCGDLLAALPWFGCDWGSGNDPKTLGATPANWGVAPPPFQAYPKAPPLVFIVEEFDYEPQRRSRG